MISNYQSKVVNIMNKYGNDEIKNYIIVRQPILKIWNYILNALSQGEFKKALDNSPYDELFHLRLDVILSEDTWISIEKTDLITMTVNPSIDDTGETEEIRRKPFNLTINELMENTRKYMGEKKFFNYSGVYNNCQDFIMGILKSNDIGTQEDYDFVKQDVKSIFKDMEFLRKFMNTATDISGFLRMLIDNGFITYKEGEQLQTIQGGLIYKSVSDYKPTSSYRIDETFDEFNERQRQFKEETERLKKKVYKITKEDKHIKAMNKEKMKIISKQVGFIARIKKLNKQINEPTKDERDKKEEYIKLLNEELKGKAEADKQRTEIENKIEKYKLTGIFEGEIKRKKDELWNPLDEEGFNNFNYITFEVGKDIKKQEPKKQYYSLMSSLRNHKKGSKEYNKILTLMRDIKNKGF